MAVRINGKEVAEFYRQRIKAETSRFYTYSGKKPKSSCTNKNTSMHKVSATYKIHIYVFCNTKFFILCIILQLNKKRNQIKRPKKNLWLF